MWDVISIFVAMIVFLCLLELLDLPDWIRARLRKGTSRANLAAKVDALELQIKALERKVQQLSE